MKNDRLVLAQTIYGEARGEGERGMQAVANVVMNRYRTHYRGDLTIAAVCKDPWQFSTWNPGDPNRAKIENLQPGAGNAVFDEAYAIAGQAIAGNLEDITGGARHYRATYASASWADPSKVSATIGNQIFYTGIA